MTDGFYAFLILTIVVWFVLGMANPMISMPPILMRYLEPSAEKPSRKMVFQWSCIFTVLLLATVLLADVIRSPEKPETQIVEATSVDVKRDLNHRTASYIHDTKMEYMKLFDLMSEAISKNNAVCTAVVDSRVPAMKELAYDIKTAEEMHAQSVPGVLGALADARFQISGMKAELEEADCL